MPKLKGSENRVIDAVFHMGDGYCLDFTDRTFTEFFEEEIEIEIYQDRYSFNGTSKAKHVRAFIELEDSYTASNFLRKLWDYKISLGNPKGNDQEAEKVHLFTIINALESGQDYVSASHLSKKAEILNLDTVTRDIDRALKSSNEDPESALTSACSTLESVCRSLLIEMGQELPKNKDLMSLYKSVREPLGLTTTASKYPKEISADIIKIMSGLITAVEGIAALRTHAGDAHGREKGYTRIDTRIASLSIHSASTIALFLVETWQRKYPDQQLKLYTEESHVY
jgi:hypothetical protein